MSFELNEVTGIRNYKYMNFRDIYGTLCTFFYEDGAISISTDRYSDEESLEVPNKMYLDREIMEKLLPYFEEFTETGEL